MLSWCSVDYSSLSDAALSKLRLISSPTLPFTVGSDPTTRNDGTYAILYDDADSRPDSRSSASSPTDSIASREDCDFESRLEARARAAVRAQPQPSSVRETNLQWFFSVFASRIGEGENVYRVGDGEIALLGFTLLERFLSLPSLLPAPSPKRFVTRDAARRIECLRVTAFVVAAKLVADDHCSIIKEMDKWLSSNATRSTSLAFKDCLDIEFEMISQLQRADMLNHHTVISLAALINPDADVHADEFVKLVFQTLVDHPHETYLRTAERCTVAVR